MNNSFKPIFLPNQTEGSENFIILLKITHYLDLLNEKLILREMEKSNNDMSN